MNAFLDLVDSYERRVRFVLPPNVAVADQMEAASADAQRLLVQTVDQMHEAEPDRLYELEEPTGLRPRAEAMILACLYLPWVERCEHASGLTLIPVAVVLPDHYAGCYVCLTLRGQRPRPEGEDDRCDFCGKRGVVEFMPVSIRSGPVVAAGDACVECGEAVKVAYGSES